MPRSSGSSPLPDEAAWLAGRETVSAHGNQPWLLDTSDACWAILDGAVDVFAVHVDQEEGTGARHHVAQAGPDSCCAAEPTCAARTSGAGGMALLAVPSPARHRRRAHPRHEVGELLADPAERLLATSRPFGVDGDPERPPSAQAPPLRKPGGDSRQHARDQGAGDSRQRPWRAPPACASSRAPRCSCPTRPCRCTAADRLVARHRRHVAGGRRAS